jgi:hypothetical protein
MAVASKEMVNLRHHHHHHLKLRLLGVKERGLLII